MQKFIRELYFGKSTRAFWFRYAMMVFDLVTIGFLVVASFRRNATNEILDLVIGLVILADFLARLWVAKSRRNDLLNPASWADMAVIVSLLAPFIGEGLAFLRVFRIVRLLRSEWVLDHWRKHSLAFRNNEKIILSAINLSVFLFLMTGLVYETQHHSNPQITNYVDALYFTTTTLSTTGYGDVTLVGTHGKLLSIVMMIAGISLFLRMVQVFLKPTKVDHACPRCGLMRHDADAVHCKACGLVLNIADEGMD